MFASSNELTRAAKPSRPCRLLPINTFNASLVAELSGILGLHGYTERRRSDVVDHQVAADSLQPRCDGHSMLMLSASAPTSGRRALTVARSTGPADRGIDARRQDPGL